MVTSNSPGSGSSPTGRTRRSIMRLTAALTASAGITGCLGDDDDDTGDGGTGNGEASSEAAIAPATGPTTLDPHNHAETTTSTILVHFYDGLVMRDTNMEIMPALAEDWENVDGTTWRFDIRDGVEFSNGEEFTAETAKYNLERVSDNLEGADATVNQDDYSSIDTVEVVDDNSIQVSLSRPDPIFLERQAQLRMVPKEFTEENGFDELENNPVGKGPYELEDWTRDQEMVMTARSDYFGGEPAIETVRWLPTPESSARVGLLTSGEVDLIRSAQPRDEETIDAAANTQIKKVPSARGAAVWLNMQAEIPGGDEPVFHNNPEVRWAVNLAVDVPAIIENILIDNGFQIHGWAYNEDFLGYNDEIEAYPHDPERAQQLLEEAGYGDGFETTLLVPRGRYFKGVSTAEAVATQLADVGIDVTLDTPEFGTFAERTQEGDIPGMMFAAWGNSTFNAIDPYSVHVHPDGLFSLLPQENQPEWVGEIAGLIEQAQSTTDREQLGDLIFQIEEMVHEQALFMFMFQYRDVYGLRDTLNWEPRSDELVYMQPASFG